MKAWIGEILPRPTNVVGAYVAKEFGVVYESRWGLIAMLHRLGFEYLKPEAIGRNLDPEKQKAFIEPLAVGRTEVGRRLRNVRSQTPSNDPSLSGLGAALASMFALN